MAMAGVGLEAIYLTEPAKITWLTGYDMIDYHLEILSGALVSQPTAAKALFFRLRRPYHYRLDHARVSPRLSSPTALERRSEWTGQFR